MKRFQGIFNDRGIGYFLASMFVFGTAVGLFSGVLNNYLYEILSIGRIERGFVEFVRELPGLLLIIIMAVLYRISENRLVRLAFAVSMVGLLGLVFVGTQRIAAVAMVVLWSTGEHLIMPVRQSIAIHSAGEGKEGLALGVVASLGNIGQVAGFYIVPVLFLVVPLIFPGVDAFGKFRSVFILAAVVVAVGFVLTGKLGNRDTHVKRQKISFKRKFSKYYILEMFFGARKQVFLTFAPYVLIIKYGARTELIAFLYGIWSLANIFLSPLIGRLIDRIGYKVLIVLDTAVTVGLCLLYGFAHHLFPEGIAFYVICAVFVLDAMLFVVGMARAVYVNSVSEDREELTSTLSTGISINHLVSIIIAVLGGVLWERLGIEILFSLAAVFGIGSFLFALGLPRPRERAAVTLENKT